MQIQTSERFLNEYNSFKAQITKCTNDKVKKELLALLDQLVNEVKDIDFQHREILITGQLPNTIKDNKHNLIELRRKIAKRIEEAKRANFIE